MNSLDFGRCVVGITIATALLAGCGGNPGAVPVASGAGTALSRHKTFHYTGGKQAFTVPEGVTQIKLVALGGNGGNWNEMLGGYGGRVSATLSVTPQEQLIVYVGGNGSGATGGFNGGGSGGAGPIYSGSNGGGAGSGDHHEDGSGDSFGGVGGGRTGGSGGTCGYDCGSAASGGTQKAGGTGGDGGGGGGGSSYVKPTATGVRMWKGWKGSPTRDRLLLVVVGRKQAMQ